MVSTNLYLNDEWFGTVKHPIGRIVNDRPLDWSYTRLTTIRLPRGLTRKDRRNAVLAAEQTFHTGNCRHEHDCCGCMFAWSHARMVGPRTMLIRTFWSRNV